MPRTHRRSPARSGPLVPRARVAALALGLACALLPSRLAAQAGLTSNIATVPLTATKSTALTVLVTAGATQTLTGLVDNAVNSFGTPVSITTTWDLQPSVGALSVVAYFSNPAQALASGSAVIPAAWMRGRVTTGSPTAFTAFTQNAVNGVGSAGGSLLLFQFSILGNNRRGTRSDALDLQLDLTGQSPLTPGTYAGTLNIRAVAQ